MQSKLEETQVLINTTHTALGELKGERKILNRKKEIKELLNKLKGKKTQKTVTEKKKPFLK